MRKILRQEEIWFSIKPTVCGCCGEKSDVVYLEGEKRLTKGDLGFSNNFSAPLVCMSCMKRIMLIIEEELSAATVPQQKRVSPAKGSPPDIEIDEELDEEATSA